jgi:hypothetical protein
MPRREKNHAELTVRVSFETTRLSTQCLVEAYECLAPGRRRALQVASNTTVLTDKARTDQGGKHA